MKKLLLSFSLVCAAFMSNAQMTFTIEEPVSVFGNAEFTYATATNSWGGPDMTLAINALRDTLILIDDNSGATNPTACAPIVNDLTGKIAFLYRGGCSFGSKALKAQNMGAVGVVIVTDAGSPIGMNGGADGLNVTIPVFMVSQADGAVMRAEIDNGEDVVVFIYNKTNFYANDLTIKSSNALMPPSTSVLAATATDNTEFNFELGTWVYNFGQNDIIDAEVVVNVDYNGSSVYTQTSLASDVLSQDSAYFSMNDFFLSTYPVGEYVLSYTVNITGGDDYTPDNTITSTFLVNDTYFAIANIDATGNLSNLKRSSELVSTLCTVYRDSNASRRSAIGIGFAAFLPPATAQSLDGQLIEVNAYSWDDVFVDMNDAGFATSNLNQVGYAEFFYSSNAIGVTQFVDFDDPFMMEDNQRYLFCVTKYEDSILFGAAGNVDYHFNQDNDAQPVQLFYDQSAGQYYADYSNTNSYSGVVVKTGAPFFASVDENEIDITPFPNPATDLINIPLAGMEGNAVLSVTDLSGKMVLNKEVSVSTSNKLIVNVADLPAGIYVFNMIFDNGTTSSFNVAVSK